MKKFAILFALLSAPLFSWVDRVHKNLPEDGFVFMETQGSPQMRWAADYLKAKAGGRYTGHCDELTDSHGAEEIPSGVARFECGAIGIARINGEKADYLRISFWDDFTVFDWHFPNAFLKNNYSANFHFINLLKTRHSIHLKWQMMIYGEK